MFGSASPRSPGTAHHQPSVAVVYSHSALYGNLDLDASMDVQISKVASMDVQIFKVASMFVRTRALFLPSMAIQIDENGSHGASPSPDREASCRR
ncbi:hypothetical protein NL676_020332 [Syzygium grande]|nr:hypothetical protein NL676_020332 [Syzygium grande]